jgi:hypothetical protein
MHDEMQPQITPTPTPDAGVQLPSGEVDREGAMAKADLFKMASYANKLHDKIGDNDQLESWVQAKITKAADYITSVYHYVEYEMQVNDFGKHLDNADTLSEGQRATLTNKLTEARAKVRELKVAQAVKVNDKKAVKESMGGEPCPACQGTGTVASAMPGARDMSAVPQHVKDKFKKHDVSTRAHHAALKRIDAEEGTMDEAFEKDTLVGTKKKTATGGTVEKTKTGLKHTAGNKYGGSTEKKELDEAKPSAGLSKKEKSAVVKKAKAGGDIGKPGKGFAKVEKAAAKSGAKDPKAVAAAAMWKNIKEGVKTASAKKAEKDYDGDGKIETGSEEHKGSVDKAIKAKEKEVVKESADVNRIKALMQRLNG